MKKFSILLVCSLCLLTIYGCGSSCKDWWNYNNDGEKNGKRVSCYENGQIKSKWKYIDWNNDGEWVYYYENGQIKSKWKYEDGKKEGKRVSYSETWEIKSEKFYKNWKVVEE